MRQQTITKFKELKYINIIIPILMVAICMILLYMNRNYNFFNSDEGDNLYGGYCITKGLDMYSEFISQHMPLTYYLCAIYVLLGIKTATGFRLAFYFTLCIIWLAMYMRYSKHFGKLLCFIYPILFVASLRVGDYTYAALSEQLWAQGIVILIAEYIIYRRTGRIDPPSLVWISFSVFISFGSCFISAYSIAVIAIAVLCNEILIQRKNKNKLSVACAAIGKRMGIVIIAVLIPFVVLLGYYAISGQLKDMIFGVYTINREYYPQYYSGISGFFSPIEQTVSQAKEWLLNIKNDGTGYLFLSVLGISLSTLMMRKKYQEACVIAVCFLMCGTRGFFTFHAIGQLSIVAILMSFLIDISLKKTIDSGLLNKGIWIIVAVSVVTFGLWASYVKNWRDILPPVSSGYAEPDNYYVDILTDENDYVWDNTLNPMVYVETGTLPAACCVVCPWIHDAYGEKAYKQLQKRRPKVIIYKENFSVWDYKAADVAPEINSFIRENYIHLEEYGDNIWLRKDCKQELLSRMDSPESYLSISK